MATRPSDTNRDNVRRPRLPRSARVPSVDGFVTIQKSNALMKKSRLQHALTDARHLRPEAAAAIDGAARHDAGVDDGGAFMAQEKQQSQGNSCEGEDAERLLVMEQSTNLDEHPEQGYNRIAEPLCSRSPLVQPFASSEDLALARRATQLTIAKMQATSMDPLRLGQLLPDLLTAELPHSFTHNNNPRKRLEKRDTRCWYAFGKLVGRGTFGRVYSAHHRLLNDSQVAIKSYFREPGAAVCCRPPISNHPRAVRSSRTATSKRSKCSPGEDALDWKRVRQEVKMMAALRLHPSIIQLIEVFETPTQLHVVMEFVKGENLCEHLRRTCSTTLRLSEPEAHAIFSQVCDAVASLHDQHVIHRDLKLENVLIDRHGRAKLIDFGFSQFDYSGGSGSGSSGSGSGSGSDASAAVKNFCGTPSYMAPEVVVCTSYDGKSVDVWSLGVLLYVLLCGRFPFQGQSLHQIHQSVLRVSTSSSSSSSSSRGWSFPGGLSKDAQNLIQSVLIVDPKKRPRVRDILVHPWMMAATSLTKLSKSVHVSPPVGDNLFQRQQRFFVAFLNWEEAQARVCEALVQLYGLNMNELMSALNDRRQNGVTAFVRLAILTAQKKTLQLIDASSTQPEISSDNNKNSSSSGLGSNKTEEPTEPATKGPSHKQHLEKLIGLVKTSLTI